MTQPDPFTRYRQQIAALLARLGDTPDLKANRARILAAVDALATQCYLPNLQISNQQISNRGSVNLRTTMHFG